MPLALAHADVLAGTWTDTTHKDKGAPLTVSFSITTKQCVRMQGGCVLHAACTWLDVLPATGMSLGVRSRWCRWTTSTRAAAAARSAPRSSGSRTRCSGTLNVRAASGVACRSVQRKAIAPASVEGTRTSWANSVEEAIQAREALAQTSQPTAVVHFTQQRSEVGHCGQQQRVK